MPIGPRACGFCVELRLSAHAELETVGEARGGVEVDAGRVDAVPEGPRGLGREVTIASE